MTIVEFIRYLEPLIHVLGSVALILLAAAGIVYLLKILIKPILVTAACISLISLVYIVAISWRG